MNMALKQPPVAKHIATAEVEPKLTQNEILEAVALALEARGDDQLLGIEGIEQRDFNELFGHSTQFTFDEARAISSSTENLIDTAIDGTIFGAIAEELAALGLSNPTTVGEVAEGLGIDLNDPQRARVRLNRLGCWCMGDVVAAEEVADRVRALMR